MAERKSTTKRPVNGIFLLDKPAGISSNHALQQVKRLFQAKKAGHTGSLDPLAHGMLPICFGEATKFSQFLLDSDKTYVVSAKLGVRTTTSDAEGSVVSERSVPSLTMADIDRAFSAFRGRIDQIPSMFSALKYQGQPLYKLARQGITVDRPSRSIMVYHLVVNDYKDHVISFELKCSKGTYVRTIVDDFGELLGCGAHVVALRRQSVGPYPESGMVSMDQLERSKDDLDRLDEYILPLSTSVSHMPEVVLTESMAFYIRQGQPVMMSSAPASGLVRLLSNTGRFIGVGEMQEGQQLSPKRLISA